MVRDEYGFHIYILEVKYLGYDYANISIDRTFTKTKTFLQVYNNREPG